MGLLCGQKKIGGKELKLKLRSVERNLRFIVHNRKHFNEELLALEFYRISKKAEKKPNRKVDQKCNYLSLHRFYRICYDSTEIDVLF